MAASRTFRRAVGLHNPLPRPTLHYKGATLPTSSSVSYWPNSGSLGGAHDLILPSGPAPVRQTTAGATGGPAGRFSGAEILRTAGDNPVVGAASRAYFIRLNIDPGKVDNPHCYYGSGNTSKPAGNFDGYLNMAYPYPGTAFVSGSVYPLISNVEQGHYVVVGVVLREKRDTTGGQGALEIGPVYNTLDSYLHGVVATNRPGEGDGQFYVDTAQAPVTLGGGSIFNGGVGFYLDEFRQYGTDLRDGHIQQILREMTAF